MGFKFTRYGYDLMFELIFNVCHFYDYYFYLLYLHVKHYFIFLKYEIWFYKFENEELLINNQIVTLGFIVLKLKGHLPDFQQANPESDASCNHSTDRHHSSISEANIEVDFPCSLGDCDLLLVLR